MDSTWRQAQSGSGLPGGASRYNAHDNIHAAVYWWLNANTATFGHKQLDGRGRWPDCSGYTANTATGRAVRETLGNMFAILGIPLEHSWDQYGCKSEGTC